MVVNYPGFEYPFIRIHETKHASGQKCEGTVLGVEFTNAPTRYYPIETEENRSLHTRYQNFLRSEIGEDRTFFAGRLAKLRLHRHGRLHATGARCRRGRARGRRRSALTGALPEVSICIPAHNAARYLPQAIDSALGQEFEDFELVVLDNASTDKTREVCEGYRDPRFRYEYEAHAGAVDRLEQVRGSRQRQVRHPPPRRRRAAAAFLTRAVEMLDSNHDVGLVHCAVEHIDESGAPPPAPAAVRLRRRRSR